MFTVSRSSVFAYGNDLEVFTLEHNSMPRFNLFLANELLSSLLPDYFVPRFMESVQAYMELLYKHKNSYRVVGGLVLHPTCEIYDTLQYSVNKSIVRDSLNFYEKDPNDPNKVIIDYVRDGNKFTKPYYLEGIPDMLPITATKDPQGIADITYKKVRGISDKGIKNLHHLDTRVPPSDPSYFILAILVLYSDSNRSTKELDILINYYKLVLNTAYKNGYNPVKYMFSPLRREADVKDYGFHFVVPPNMPRINKFINETIGYITSSKLSYKKMTFLASLNIAANYLYTTYDPRVNLEDATSDLLNDTINLHGDLQPLTPYAFIYQEQAQGTADVPLPVHLGIISMLTPVRPKPYGESVDTLRTVINGRDAIAPAIGRAFYTTLLEAYQSNPDKWAGYLSGAFFRYVKGDPNDTDNPLYPELMRLLEESHSRI